MIISSFNNQENVMFKVPIIRLDQLEDLAASMHEYLSEPNYLEVTLKENLDANFATLRRGGSDSTDNLASYRQSYTNYIKLNIAYASLQQTITRLLMILDSFNQAKELIADLDRITAYYHKGGQSKQAELSSDIISRYEHLLKSSPYHLLNFSRDLMTSGYITSFITSPYNRILKFAVY